MRVGRLTAGLFAGALLAAAGAPAANAADVWESVPGTPPTAGAQVDADSLKAFTLDRSALQSTLAGAQKGSSRRGRHDRALGARARRHAAALRRARDVDHGAGAGGQASGDQDLRGPGPRRPDGLDRRRHEPAGLPRVGAGAPGRVLRRPVLQGRDERARVLLHARCEQRRGALVRRVRPGRREQGRGRHGRRRARPGGPAAHLPARADHRPELRDLLRGRQRHRGQGHADEPREPDLQHRVRDQARPDRRHRHAQPQHGRAGHGRERPVRLGARASRPRTPATRCSTATGS